MQIRNIPHQRGAIRKAVGIVGPALVLAISEYLLHAQGVSNKLPGVGLGSAPKLIYSSNADDAWNRIFFFLFSRRLQVRLSADFPEGAPFISSAGNPTVSSRTFERDETGDRAVDPLYPTYSVGVGSMLVLSDSAYPEFTAALHDALNENVQRSTIARALMQSDLWGAYDGLFPAFLPDDERRLGERRKTTLDLIGRLIRKVALTPDEINALPDNYASVVRHQSFPDMFAQRIVDGLRLPGFCRARMTPPLAFAAPVGFFSSLLARRVIYASFWKFRRILLKTLLLWRERHC